MIVSDHFLVIAKYTRTIDWSLASTRVGSVLLILF